MKTAALYARVSATDQELENQLSSLRDIADRRGWHVITSYQDFGISGAKGRDKRPGLDQMLKDAQRHKFDIVMAWSVDRLGRSLDDLLSTLNHLQACNCDLFLERQALDTSTPAGRAMFQMLGVFAEFERNMIRERIIAGMARAKARGVRFGRRVVSDAEIAKATELLSQGIGINRTARLTGLGDGTVFRIKQGMNT